MYLPNSGVTLLSL
jgi:hypothetical protein